MRLIKRPGMKICITLCTRERPQMLARCLSSLPAAIANTKDSVCLVVVENDVVPKSRDIVLGFQAQMDIHYVLETKLGIPFARNRAVTEALARDVDWLIFIDDDEWVSEDWLKILREARDSYPNAEVLTGPVLRTYPAGAPDWLPIEAREREETGTSLSSAATNNTKVAAQVFREDGYGLRFEERMRFTGGSDTEIFLRLTQAGGQVVWVDKALVYEEYPDNRSTLSWHIARNVRRASGGVLIAGLHGQSRLWYVLPRMGWCLYVTLGRFLKGVLSYFSNRRQGHTHIMKAILSFASFWGYLRGLFRLESHPYRIQDEK